MIYRTLGKTGLRVSQLGFGAMRLPMIGEGDEKRVDRERSTPMIHRAFEGGVNYIDSAVGYCNRDSQRAVGDALASWPKREEIVVSTKNHDYGEDEAAWWKNLEDSLERLQVDAIDVYHHHGTNWKKYTEALEPRVGKWMRKAVDQGLVKHVACSYHDSAENLFKLVDTGYPEVLTVQYNMLDRSLEDAIAHADERGVGVVVMGPVAGGRLGGENEVFGQMVPGVGRVPELAVRFVLANPHVAVALSGMSRMEEVEENVATAADDTPLSDADRAAIDRQLERLANMADLYCTGCGYCLPCPAGVAIPDVFRIYNSARVYGLWDHAKRAYAGIGRNEKDTRKRADACTDCGACEEKCPQDIPVRAQLREAHDALAGE